MEIKRQLKNLDIKISKLARELSISRPTLDAYIESYENGRILSNQLYQAIFDYLFSSENISAVEFAKKFDYVKRNFLQNADERETSKEDELKNTISDSLYEKQLSVEMLEFVKLFINNGQVDLVDAFCQYFNYVNGLKLYSPQSHSEQDAALFSLLFKIFKQYKDGSIERDEESLHSFMDKNKKIFERKEKNGAVNEVIEYLKLHVGDNSSLDLEYVKKLLDKKEN